MKPETQTAFQTLIELLNKSVTRSDLAEKPCLQILRTDRRENLTFEQLRTAACDFALWLIQTKGIQLGDKIAIIGKNRIDWDIALWAIILAGAVPVLIDPERPPEGVKRHLTTTDTRMIVLADDYLDVQSRQQLEDFAAAAGLSLLEMTGKPFCGLPHAKTCSDPDLLQRARPDALWCPCTVCRHNDPAKSQKTFDSDDRDRVLREIAAQVQPDDTAVILCTSGTTNDPREVELTHTNLITNIQGTLQTVRVTGDDRLGHIIPPHHSFGFTVTKLLPLWVGATNVYTNKHRQIPQIIKENGITVFIGIPALFTVLAEKIDKSLAEKKQKSPFVSLADSFLPKLVGTRIVRKQGWHNLRFFLCGAAPLPKWVLQAFWKRGLHLYEGYGTTENSPVYGFNSDPRKLGSVGKPIPTLLVRIINDKNQTLPPGQRGEILLGGTCVMKGYYKNPAATQAVISTDENGIRWLHTGDLGYLDRQGHLFITGRKKYMIVLPGGKNVNPELVESVLSRAPYVKEILVVPASPQTCFEMTPDENPPPRKRQKLHAFTALVRPAWDVIQNDTSLSTADLLKQPQLLKNLVWQSINECQRKTRQLSHFEKVSPHRLEIKMDEFIKTSTGKIKRDPYIKTGP